LHPLSLIKMRGGYEVRTREGVVQHAFQAVERRITARGRGAHQVREHADPVTRIASGKHWNSPNCRGRAGNRRPLQGVAFHMTTEVVSRQTGFAGRVATAIRDMHPSYFAFVMATGIISTGASLLGPSWLSLMLLVIASIGFAVLVAALVIWLAHHRSRVGGRA
jgi:hypothetical protein